MSQLQLPDGVHRHCIVCALLTEDNANPAVEWFVGKEGDEYVAICGGCIEEVRTNPDYEDIEVLS